MLPTFEKSTFCKGLYGENDGLSIQENGTRNIYSNYNQMRKKLYLMTFPSSNQQNFVDSRIVRAVSVSQFYQSIAVQP